MLVWHNATTVRIHHFFLVEKAYAVSLRLVASLSLVMLLSPTRPCFGSTARADDELSLSVLGWSTRTSFSAVFFMFAEKSAKSTRY